MMEQVIENDTSYTLSQVDETMKYLTHLKFSNRKAYNKLNKRGRKFSETVMKRLK